MAGGKLPQGPGLTQVITTSVLENSQRMQLFSELHEHQFDTALEDNHIHLLTKKICSYYVRIRFYHLGKEYTEAATKPSVRHKLTKTILFKHQ